MQLKDSLREMFAEIANGWKIYVPLKKSRAIRLHTLTFIRYQVNYAGKLIFTSFEVG